MIKWIKIITGGTTGIIKMMDELEAPLADYFGSLQEKIKTMSPQAIAKGAVDKMQRRLCVWFKKNPSDVGLLDTEGL